MLNGKYGTTCGMARSIAQHDTASSMEPNDLAWQALRHSPGITNPCMGFATPWPLKQGMIAGHYSMR
jgi:transcription antitermination factor NusG